MPLKLSILSLSEEDVDFTSPDLPHTVDWSADMCREADRRIGNQRLLQQTRPPLRRGRSLEQLLEACQTENNDDCDNIIALSTVNHSHTHAKYIPYNR